MIEVISTEFNSDEALLKFKLKRNWSIWSYQYIAETKFLLITLIKESKSKLRTKSMWIKIEFPFNGLLGSQLNHLSTTEFIIKFFPGLIL